MHLLHPIFTAAISSMSCSSFSDSFSLLTSFMVTFFFLATVHLLFVVRFLFFFTADLSPFNFFSLCISSFVSSESVISLSSSSLFSSVISFPLTLTFLTIPVFPSRFVFFFSSSILLSTFFSSDSFTVSSLPESSSNSLGMLVSSCDVGISDNDTKSCVKSESESSCTFSFLVSSSVG